MKEFETETEYITILRCPVCFKEYTSEEGCPVLFTMEMLFYKLDTQMKCPFCLELLGLPYFIYEYHGKEKDYK